MIFTDNYITGTTIKRLREEKQMTQASLAQILDVSPKTVSKWETAKGLPDITLIDPLAKALNVSVLELMSGNTAKNKNVSGNMLKTQFYCCPVCSNIINALGEASISCCGITLPPLEAEETDEQHKISVEVVEDEYFISINHPMTKEHFISFIAFATCDKIETVKFYPEGNAECRFKIKGRGFLYAYCNRHGLMKQKI